MAKTTYTRNCLYCQNEFIAHDKYKKYCNLTCSTTHKNKKIRQLKIEKYNNNPKLCSKCQIPIDYDKRKLNKFCSSSCASIHFNEIKYPKALRKVYTSRIIHSPVSKQCPTCHKEFHLTHVKRRQKYCSPPCIKKGGYRSKSQITKKIIQYNGNTYDSGAEIYFAKLCDHHHIKYIRNDGQYKFPYYNSRTNSIRHYYPDFYMPDLELYIEIKGKRFLNQTVYDKLGSTNKPCMLIMYDKIKNYFS